MKRILISLAVSGAVLGTAVFATNAFFSDAETSTGNTFQAGAIDLKISNTSYLNGVFKEGNSWTSTNLDDPQNPKFFFSFRDLKPGDLGEDTIDVKVDTNDAWACMKLNVTGTPENGQSEPEALVDNTAGSNDGELQKELHFTFWADDGDNVLETDEVGKVFVNDQTIQQLSDGNKVVLADASHNVWNTSGPLTGSATYYIGKVWCYGALTQNAVTPGNGNPTQNSGFLCNGTNVSDASQTDGVTADVIFSAVQSRNNLGFLCNPQS